MKRLIFVQFSLLILLICSIYITPVQVAVGDQKINLNENKSNLGLDQVEFTNGEYQPIFVSITSQNIGDVIEVRNRNETLGEGAIYRTTSYKNVTFNYAVALSNETSFDESQVDFRLMADLPIVNTTNFNNTNLNPQLSFTDPSQTIRLNYTNTNQTNFINYTLPYDSSLQIQNATLYYFQTTLQINVSASYIPFFVRELEDSTLNEVKEDRPLNLITTEAYFNTSSQDEFYVQNEIVNITGSIFFADNNVEGFGIVYTLNSSNIENFENFTVAFNGNDSAIISLNTYNPDTVISWESLMYANDTLVNQTRKIERLESKVTTVGDGRPIIEVDLSSDHPKSSKVDDILYSQNFTVLFFVTGNVPKGNITNITLTPDTDLDPIPFAQINGSFENTQLNLTVDFLEVIGDETSTIGNFSVKIEALTDKNLKTEDSFRVIIDQNNPSADLDNSFIPEDGIIITDNGKITFNFTAEDDHSGIRVMYLDLGDNTIVEVTGMESYTHKYRNYNNSLIIVSLTVIDFAGNEAFRSLSFNIQQQELDRTRPPIIGYVVFFAFLVALITSYYWAPWINEKIRG